MLRLIAIGLLFLLWTPAQAQVEPSVTYDPATGNYVLRYEGISGEVYEVILEPSTKIDPEVQARVTASPNSDLYRYGYKVSNGASSKQRLYAFRVTYRASIEKIEKPTEKWTARAFGERPIFSWANYKDPYGRYHPLDGIASDSSVSGFVLESPGLPTVVQAYFKGARSSGLGFPEEPPSEIEAALDTLDRFPHDTVQEKTIGPRAVSTPLGHAPFLDTLRTYPQRAFDQGWITDAVAADRYQTNLDQAATYLAAGDSARARAALETVATEAAADSGQGLTAEGYALLYYNASYLAERLPEGPPPSTGCGQVPADVNVSFATTSVWATGYNAEVTLTNTGDTAIRGWTLAFTLPAPIQSLWDGQLAGSLPTYTVADAGYNGTVLPGESATFGLQVQSDTVSEPTGYAVNAVDCAAEAPSVDIAFATTSVWSSGYNAEVTLTNTGSQPIRGWRFGFTLGAPIQSLWNGQLSGSQPSYTVTDAGHNGVIGPGQTVTVGFQVESETVIEPSNYDFAFWALGP